jgi:hypothetical protein
MNDFMKRLVLDIQSQVAGPATILFTVPKIVSQATYFKNMLVGNEMLSAFEHAEDTNHPCAAYTDALLSRNVSLHMTRGLHVELCSASVVSEMLMCYHATNCRRELKFCSMSRTLLKRTFCGGKLVILLTRATILLESGEIGTAEAAD